MHQPETRAILSPALKEPADVRTLRSHARSNRARLLEHARNLLSEDPETPLDDIARAAGVVRRTLYAHFPSRTALIEALAEEASAALAAVVAAVPVDDARPEREFAELILAIWPVGDRYRMLLALGRSHLGTERVTEFINPASMRVAATIERAQRTGVFHHAVPAAVLSRALAEMHISLTESVNAGLWDGNGEDGATTLLVAVGVPHARAQRAVRAAARSLAARSPDGEKSAVSK